MPLALPTSFPLLARGVLLGLGAAVPIGPVNVEIARRTLRGGFPAGFCLGCGAVTVDVTYAVVSSLSFTRLLTDPRVSRVISAAGVAVLAYLAVQCFRAAARAMRADPLLERGAIHKRRPVPRRPRRGAPRRGRHTSRGW